MDRKLAVAITLVSYTTGLAVAAYLNKKKNEEIAKAHDAKVHRTFLDAFNAGWAQASNSVTNVKASYERLFNNPTK